MHNYTSFSFTCTCTYTLSQQLYVQYVHNYTHPLDLLIHYTVFWISLYGSPTAQRASYLAQHSSLFGSEGAVNYDYNVTNTINSMLIGSRCILNAAHTNHC